MALPPRAFGAVLCLLQISAGHFGALGCQSIRHQANPRWVMVLERRIPWSSATQRGSEPARPKGPNSSLSAPTADVGVTFELGAAPQLWETRLGPASCEVGVRSFKPSDARPALPQTFAAPEVSQLFPNSSPFLSDVGELMRNLNVRGGEENYRAFVFEGFCLGRLAQPRCSGSVRLQGWDGLWGTQAPLLFLTRDPSAFP